MTKLVTWLDRTALALTGVGVIGGALSAIDVLPAPSGVVYAVALGVGVITGLFVRTRARRAPEAWAEDVPEIDLSFAPHPDPFRIKTPISDPLDPTVPGTVNWNAQFNSKGPQP